MCSRVSKYWSNVNKDKKPRDLFYALKKPNENGYETRSDRMAELTRNYHEQLQFEDIRTNEPQRTRKENIEQALESATATLDEAEAELLRGKVTRGEIETALDNAGRGKATGLDGLPYEFWTKLRKRWETSSATWVRVQ